ncbi:MAG: LysM peptidoglycan-binding domain-containing protein [Anaerolineae bacterium]
MRHTQLDPMAIVALVLVLAITALAGCSQPVEAGAAANSGGYASALNTTYEDALDVRSQLALGTIDLEGTANAVTSAQAANLLPLWEAVAGNALQGTEEREAVLVQIEDTMTADQLAAIAVAQLTGQDAQAWLESQRPTAEASGGQMPQGASQAAPAGNASAMPAPSGGSGTAGGASYLLAQAAVTLLTERSGATATEAAPLETEPTTVEPLFMTEPAAASEPATEAEAAATSDPVVGSEPALLDESAAQIEPAAQAEVTPVSEADSTPEQTTSTTASEAIHVVQAGDTVAAIARAYGVTVQAIVAANGLLDANVIVVGQELIIPDPAQVPAVTSTASGSIASSVDSIGTVTQRLPGLEQMPDTNPGPPFTVEVSANYAVQDPLVAKSRTYTVTGIVRNDGDETYAVSDIMVTFYDADGFRGTFSPAIRDGKLVGGEWHWHGEVQAEFAALLLAPGEEWPFSIQITAQDMASFLIHADAAPTGREPAQVELSGVRLVDEGTGYLRISGTATNASPFKAKGLTVSGVLLDANGQIVSLGSTYVLDEGIEPGASVAFDLRVEQTSYASYQLYAQAEHDW